MKGTTLLGIFLVVLVITTVSVSAKEDATFIGPFLKIWKAILDLQQKVTDLQSQINAIPKTNVKHVVLLDGTCVDNPNIGPIGWCPDEIRSDFTIQDPDYTKNSTIIGNYVAEFSVPHVIKRPECIVNAVSFDGDTPYLRFVCVSTPIEGSQLTYALIN